MKSDDIKQELNNALFELNRLQSENYDGAEHDLEVIQEKINQLLIAARLEHGTVRLAIECHPKVRKLRNELDNISFNGKLSKKLRSDVLELMLLRDEAAKELGYNNYPSAILEAEKITLAELQSILNRYLERHLPSVQVKVSQYHISMREWFPWLDSHNKLDKTYDSIELLQGFAHIFGLNDVLSLLDIKVKDSFCYACQTNKNIYMQVSPMKSIYDWSTLFHEFGHACIYSRLPQNTLPWLSSLVDEVVAVLFENAAVRFIADESIREKALNLLHMEYTRTCISALFELELWQDRSNPESLYTSWYTQLGVKIDQEDWIMDSFRSLDCMTIFAYTIGQAIADSLSDEQLKNMIVQLLSQLSDLTLHDIIYSAHI